MMLSEKKITDGTQTQRPLRAWPVWWLALVSLGCLFLPTALKMPDYIRFFTLAIGALVQCIVLISWALLASNLRWLSRVLMLLAGGVIVILAMIGQHKSHGISIFLYGIPVAIIVLALVTYATSRQPWEKQRWIMLLGWAVSIFAWMPLRSEGYMASFVPQLRWRWSMDAETRALQSLEKAKLSGEATTAPVEVRLGDGDWPRFRGVAADGQTVGIELDPSIKVEPRVLWRKAAGPSWGSLVVVDRLVFTLEQRGKMESIICLDANKGNEIWSYGYEARFEDVTQVSGVGPRGTPTFFGGKLYCVGGTGHVVALHAHNGKLIWERDLVADTRGRIAQWGFSTSPYVDAKYCIVMSNNEEGQNIDTICYDQADGRIVWAGEEGGASYSSPQVVELFGVKQVLVALARMKGEKKGILLISRDYETGAELWRYEGQATGNAMLTPIVVGENRVLATLGGEGVCLLEVSHHTTDGWKASELWTQNRLLPEFSDMVVQNELVLGLSKGPLTALNLLDGKLRWKKFRFGAGQLIGLANKNSIIVMSEEGKLAWIRITSQGPELLAEFDGLTGKTWNHPVMVGNRIYCRNYEEIACIECQQHLP